MDSRSARDRLAAVFQRVFDAQDGAGSAKPARKQSTAPARKAAVWAQAMGDAAAVLRGFSGMHDCPHPVLDRVLFFVVIPMVPHLIHPSKAKCVEWRAWCCAALPVSPLVVSD